MIRFTPPLFRSMLLALGLVAVCLDAAVCGDLPVVPCGGRIGEGDPIGGLCLGCCPCESCSRTSTHVFQHLFPCPAQQRSEPWQLFGDCCLLERSRITVDGFVQQGATLNARSPTNPPNAPGSYVGIGSRPGGGFPYRANEYMFNQVLLSVHRETDTSRRCWDVGGHLDILYGMDYILYQMRGLEVNDDLSNRWNGGSGRGLSLSAGNPDGVALMGLAMPQLYLQVACHDLSVKLGRFYIPLGYERALVTQNNYYSNTYAGFYNPESAMVLGALAEWRLNPQLVMLGGFHRGFGNWTDNNDDLDVMGGFQWTAPSQRVFVNYFFDVGRDDDLGQSIRYTHAIVLKFKISDRWGYTITSDYGHTENLPSTGADADWYGVVQYLDYKINACWATGIRFEWFDDIDGSRVFPNPLALPLGPGVWQELTLGFNYRHSPNVVVRPEIRWDWFTADAGVPPGPFADGTERSQFTAAVDMIVSF